MSHAFDEFIIPPVPIPKIDLKDRPTSEQSAICSLLDSLNEQIRRNAELEARLFQQYSVIRDLEHEVWQLNSILFPDQEDDD